jgi:hypothetical protein
MTRRFLGILLGRFQGEHAKDVEIAVLRHQLSVLCRQRSRSAIHRSSASEPPSAKSQLGGCDRLSGTHRSQVKVKTSADTSLKRGQRVWLGFPLSRLYFFDSQSGERVGRDDRARQGPGSREFERDIS